MPPGGGVAVLVGVGVMVGVGEAVGGGFAFVPPGAIGGFDRGRLLGWLLGVLPGFGLPPLPGVGVALPPGEGCGGDGAVGSGVGELVLVAGWPLCRTANASSDTGRCATCLA